MFRSFRFLALRSSALPFLAIALMLVVPGFTAAQGLLVDTREDQEYRLPRPIWPPHPPHPPLPRPRPPRPAPEPAYQIKELEVNVNLQDQIAKVQLSQSFHNNGSRPLEVSFIFPLPYDGAIDHMTFMLDGKEYEAKLLKADEARKIYEGYVRRNQDPALVEWMGTGMFKTSVFPVPPGATRKVTLKFSQLCRKTAGLTELTFPFSTAKYTSRPVEKVSIQVSIQSQAKIKNVYSPNHTVEVKRPTDSAAQVSYSGSNEIPTTDFRLLYDVGDGAVGANVLSYRPKENEDGYFMLLVSPEIKRAQEKPIPKTVVFVVDRSGSMSGKKIEQAKGALRFVLNNLNEGDLFNIVAYDNSIENFRPELQRFDDETRKAALGFTEGIYAGGSTNIDGALKAALGQLQDNSRPNFVVFLTDGLPTAGERNEARIAENAKENNKVRARIFSMGVGYDVNSRLLDKLARMGFGQSHYVRPNEDIEAHVSQLYARIGAPALTEMSITFDMEGFPAERGNLVNRLYPRDAYDLFAGDQLVLVGRYKDGGAAKVTIRGSIEGNKQEYHFPVSLVKKSNDESFAFTEKLWAMRRVGEIIDEIDLKGKNEELVNELVSLATEHGILTPYTSFLADENANLRDVASTRMRAGVALEQLDKAEGVSGFVQRDIKAQLQRSNSLAEYSLGAQPADALSASPTPAAAGLGGARTPSTAPAAPSGAGGYAGRAAMPALRKLEDDTPIAVTNVRQLGSKTFYKRDNRWIDSTLTEAQEKAMQKVERFSREYFDLLAKHREIGKYIASDEETVIVVDGQAYSL